MHLPAAPPGWRCGKGSSPAVPVFTCVPIDEGGTQLYPGDPGRLATDNHLPADVHTWLVWPSDASNTKVSCAHPHTDPHPPDWSRFHLTRPQTLVPRVCLLVLLAGPAPSGSTGTSRLCQGRLPPKPTHSLGVPAALSFTQAAVTTQGSGSLTPIRNTSASRRTFTRWWRRQ